MLTKDVFVFDTLENSVNWNVFMPWKVRRYEGERKCKSMWSSLSKGNDFYYYAYLKEFKIYPFSTVKLRQVYSDKVLQQREIVEEYELTEGEKLPYSLPVYHQHQCLNTSSSFHHPQYSTIANASSLPILHRQGTSAINYTWKQSKNHC